jgi:hypothetical protein
MADLPQWLCEVAPPACTNGVPEAPVGAGLQHLAALLTEIIPAAFARMIAEQGYLPSALLVSLPALAALFAARSIAVALPMLLAFFIWPAMSGLSYARFYSCNHGTCEDGLGTQAIALSALYSAGLVLSLAYLAYRLYRAARRPTPA